MPPPCCSAAAATPGGLCSPLPSAAGPRRAARATAAVRPVSAAASSERPRSVELGRSGLMVPEMGVGVWSWGDRNFWNDGEWGDANDAGARGAYKAAMDSGLTLLDTAEVYGTAQGGAEDSEVLCGRYRRELGGDPILATKFAALPWRLGEGAVVKTCKESLDKMGVDCVDLYQLHWPGLWGNDGYLDGLAACVEQGLVKTVGVSNYSEKRLRKAHAALAARGIPLASNQIQYSVLYREPENNGVYEACQELGVSVIAYSPIGSGLLTGKYTPQSPPTGPRGITYNAGFLGKVAPLLDMLRQMGEEKGGYSTMQVSLAWLLAQDGVVPIPGAKNERHVADIVGALGLRLTSAEEEEIRIEARKVPSLFGFPAEKF